MITARRLLLAAGVTGLLCISCVAYWLLQEIEYTRLSSPKSGHVALITYHRYQSLLPMAPGQSGDKPGYIRITDASGRKYPKLPIPMIQMSRDIIWTKNGATLPLCAEWNFITREVRYWDSAQTRETVIKIR